MDSVRSREVAHVVENAGPGIVTGVVPGSRAAAVLLAASAARETPPASRAASMRSASARKEEFKMPKKRKPYPSEYRRQMVDLARSGRSPAALAHEFELSAPTIRDWIKQVDLDEGRRSDGTTTRERDDLRRLKRENKRLRLERDILKKPGPGLPRRATRSPSGIRVRKAHRAIFPIRAMHLDAEVGVATGPGRRRPLEPSVVAARGEDRGRVAVVVDAWNRRGHGLGEGDAPAHRGRRSRPWRWRSSAGGRKP